LFQVLDGGAVVIRGQPRNGPPPERTLALAEIEAPRLSRRPGPNNQEGTTDEPYAWEAREFLRRLLVGKSILATVTNAGGSGREYGSVLYGSPDPEQAEDATVKLVAEGMVKVRDNSNNEKLKEAQEAAKSAGKGIWGSECVKSRGSTKTRANWLTGMRANLLKPSLNTSATAAPSGHSSCLIFITSL